MIIRRETPEPERGENVRSKRDYSGYQSTKLRPEVSCCGKCGRRLRFAYRSDRHVAFLTDRQEIIYDAWRCENPHCDGPDNHHVPLASRLGMLPKFEYGLDVIAFIGQHRLKSHATFAEIGQNLREDYHVPISDRSVEDHFAVYLALVSTDIAHDSQRLAKLRAQGKLLLALDGLKPERDGESLWVFRDTLSAEVLKAVAVPSMDTIALAGHLREIKALGVPIAGVISDAQNIILKAVAEVLPGVPHQLCQIHFLRDFAKPVTAADQALQQDLGTRLKGLGAFEKAAAEDCPKGPKAPEIKAPKSVTLTPDAPASSRSGPGRPRTHVRLQAPKTADERILVRDVCEMLRAILKNHGRYPLEAPGLETRDMLKTLLDALDQGLKKGALDSSSCSSSVNTSRLP